MQGSKSIFLRTFATLPVKQLNYTLLKEIDEYLLRFERNNFGNREDCFPAAVP